VQQRPDEALAGAARNAVAKIATASPDDLRERIGNTGLWPVRSDWSEADAGPLLMTLREAIRNERVLEIAYADETGRTTRRAVWPITLAYYEQKQILAAWCTLREDFRNFRTDRIAGAEPVAGRFGRRRAQLAREWEDIWRQQVRERYPDAAD
jgi:predicted DNA-binding transcriptional regulator YafY